MAVAWFLAAAAVLLHIATNGRYGYFRDELYYIATSDHLAWGYVDFAPLASLLLRVSRTVLGDVLCWGIRCTRFGFFPHWPKAPKSCSPA